jgi:hypothetical protein
LAYRQIPFCADISGIFNATLPARTGPCHPIPGHALANRSPIRPVWRRFCRVRTCVCQCRVLARCPRPVLSGARPGNGRAGLSRDQPLLRRKERRLAAGPWAECTFDGSLPDVDPLAAAFFPCLRSSASRNLRFTSSSALSFVLCSPGAASLVLCSSGSASGSCAASLVLGSGLFTLTASHGRAGLPRAAGCTQRANVAVRFP